MKKKFLAISLSLGAVAIIFLAIFGIVSAMPEKKPKTPQKGTLADLNIGNNKGSLEDPYYIYDTETFVDLLTKYGGKIKPVREKITEVVYEEIVDVNGNTVKQEKRDEDGNIIYAEKCDENGNVMYRDIEGQTEVYHFELYCDIDFAGDNFVTIFDSADERFIGEINGKGKVVKNVSISVTRENLMDYVYVSNSDPKEFSSHIGIFGSTDGAVISNIGFENISVKVDGEVFAYLKGTGNDYFGNDNQGIFKEFVVGSVIAYAKNTTLKADVSATVDSDAYAVFGKNQGTDESKILGRNSVGGVVGYAENSLITSYKEGENVAHNISVVCDDGNRGYYVGGVTGYLVNSTVSRIDLNADIVTISAADQDVRGNVLYLGGISGYVSGSSIEESNVTLKVRQSESEHINLENETAVDNDLYNKVGGVVSVIRADSEEQISNIRMVNVSTDIDMDCLFAGLIYEVRSDKYLADDGNGGKLDRYKTRDEETAEDKNTIYVNLVDNIISSNVAVIKAYGIGGFLCYTNIEYTEGFTYATEDIEGKTANYNVRLTGSTRLATNTVTTCAYVVSSNDTSNTIHFSLTDIKLIYSKDIGFGALDMSRITFPAFGYSEATAL